MERIRLNVLGLSYGMSQAGAYALILADESNKYRVPVMIGVTEAQSIAMQLEHLQPQRPLTHDLVKKMMDFTNMILVEIYIHHWEAGVYYADMLFAHEQGEIKIDARTSDAVALALRASAPIFMARSILEKTAILIQENEIIIGGITASEMGAPVQQKPEMSVEELTRLMEEAVQHEDYESASRYRDMLKAKQKR